MARYQDLKVEQNWLEDVFNKKRFDDIESFEDYIEAIKEELFWNDMYQYGECLEYVYSSDTGHWYLLNVYYSDLITALRYNQTIAVHILDVDVVDELNEYYGMV